MKFSIVIPLYNKAPYIIQALKSVLAQRFTDYEILVVDDGSTDESYRMAQGVPSARIRLLRQENQGVSVARNTAIALAQGEFIAFLDADDWWEPNHLQTLSDLTVRFPESDLFVTAYAIHLGGNRVRHSPRLGTCPGCLPSYWETLGLSYDFVWTSATAIRREAVLRAGCFRPGEQIGQDLELWGRVARRNPRVAYSPVVSAHYNRMATENARIRVKVAHAAAFLCLLEEELDNPRHTRAERQAIFRKYDKKMTVYVFTCLLAGQTHRGLQALKAWGARPNFRNALLRFGLRVARWMPPSVLRWAFQLRLNYF